MANVVTTIELDGAVWASLGAGESFTFGRGGDGAVVDRIVSANDYVSAHAGTILGTPQTCWIQNWSSHTPMLLSDLHTVRSVVEVPAGSQRLNPFPEARVELFATPGERVTFTLRSSVLRELETLPGRQPTGTRSQGQEARERIRRDPATHAQTNLRQWYSCLAL